MLNAVSTLFAVLGDDADVLIDEINERPKFAEELAVHIRTRLNLHISYDHARAIMGPNFLGLRDASRYFGVQVSDALRARMQTIPFSARTLRECSDTHMLVAVPPLALNEMRQKFAESRISFDPVWDEREPFADARVIAGWTLIQKAPLANSTCMNWQSQQRLLDTRELVPDACALVYAIVCYYRKTNEMLFKDKLVRCSDLIGSHRHAVVGMFGHRTLCGFVRSDSDSADELGLASMRIS